MPSTFTSPRVESRVADGQPRLHASLVGQESAAACYESYPLQLVTREEALGQVAPAQGRRWCELLELGRILCWPQVPFELPDDDVAFLRSQRQSSSRFHKNIAYRPAEDRISGVDRRSVDAVRLLDVMRSFSRRAAAFVGTLLSAYHGAWRLDYASFRPLQEQGRAVRLHARNDLLHIDAFPTRPTFGDRILRLFVNISPTEPRRWLTSDHFARTVVDLGGSDALPWPRPASRSLAARFRRGLCRAARRCGLPVVLRSAYDDFMVRMYRHMKENALYQAHCPKFASEFPPGCCWMVYTDAVPHAVLRGQYALEQTFIVSRQAMVCPEKAPIHVLEAICGRPLTDVL
jgi:hypothetical protein